jgi:hypothetical protein
MTAQCAVKREGVIAAMLIGVIAANFATRRDG